MRFAIGLLFLAIQAASILYARFVPARYFCWAPYDTVNEYRILAESPSGEILWDAEIQKRYRLPAEGRDNRSIEHVIRILRQRETTDPAPDYALKLLYRINGRGWKKWQWPEPAQ